MTVVWRPPLFSAQTSVCQCVSMCLVCLVCESGKRKLRGRSERERERGAAVHKGAVDSPPHISPSPSLDPTHLIMWSCSRCPAPNTNCSLWSRFAFTPDTVYTDVLVHFSLLGLAMSSFCHGPHHHINLLNVTHPVIIWRELVTLLRTWTAHCCKVLQIKNVNKTAKVFTHKR